MASNVDGTPCYRTDLAGKTVYIIRHAQGQHNVSVNFDYDPVLTKEGLAQVQRQRGLAESLGVDLVLVSPLRRTLQTATGLFPKHGNMVAYEELREGVSETCNLRLPREVAAPNFPQVNFELIAAGKDPHLYRWELPFEKDELGPKEYQRIIEMDCRNDETDKDMDDRAEAVIAFVAARPESKIALVSHAMFLHALILALRKGAPASTARQRSRDPYADYLDNCEIRELQRMGHEAT